MKKRAGALITLLIFLFSAIQTSASSGEGVNWYVKRCGSKRPEISEEQAVIEKYDGYYVDKKLTESSDDRKIYLTFDAGYENGNVAKILDILKEKQVCGAFFILDHIVLSATDVVKRMHDEGHIVANHTKNHKDLTAMTDEQMKNNLMDLERIYEEKTGCKMSSYFRFPEGRYSERTLKCARDLGYKTIFWSLGYADWDNKNQPSAQKAMKILLDNTHNGAVILLHPTSDTNVKILPLLIDEWRQMGYTFGTLDELVAK